MNQIVIFQMELSACSGKLRILSYGLICAEKCWKWTQLENSSKNFANIGNLNETNYTLLIKVVPCSGKIWIRNYGAIVDDAEPRVLDHKDYPGNDLINVNHIGNWGESNGYLSNELSTCSGKLWILIYASRCDVASVEIRLFKKL